MPLYSFTCPQGHRHEKIKAIESRHTDTCPVCGERANLTITVPNVRKFPVKAVRLNGEEIR